MVEEYRMFQKVIDFNNLYKAYLKAKSGKGLYKQKIKFEMSALDGILQIRESLINKTFCVDPYNKFTVYEPKERVIEAGSFKDKIVQHCLCDNVLLPMLETEFILTNVAGQRNKGTHFGLDCLKAHMLQAYEMYSYDCWIIKADIRKYFYRIDHSILKEILKKHFRDPDIYWLCEKFIDSVDDIGLPLGNQITQVFALLYLSELDHYIVDLLQEKFYGRYMDDFYLIVKTKEEAKKILEKIREYVDNLHLELNEKTQIVPFKNGIRYCGFHTYITEDGTCIRKLLNEKKREAKKKYKKLALLVKNGKIEKEKFWESYVAWKNHISFGNCVKLGYEMDRYVERLLIE